MSEMIGGACCPVVTIDGQDIDITSQIPSDLTPFEERVDETVIRMRFLVDGIHCGACIQTIETALKQHEGIRSSRVNFSTNRLVVEWDETQTDVYAILTVLAKKGYRGVPYSAAMLEKGKDDRDKALLKAMAVAGFAASNVMLLSVSIWSGHFSDMGPHTRSLMHWLSALIAIPAIIYSGRVFFDSAISALKQGRTNMDVPISLAVVLATGMSLSETMRGADHAYFDSAITLMFFLLVGRYLDHRARGKARAVAEHMLSLNATAVSVIQADGGIKVVTPDQVQEGDRVLVAAGERISVDGRIVSGTSDVDSSVITGESLPESMTIGDRVFAGSMNLGQPLTLEVVQVGESTLLAEICRLMEHAEQRRADYVTLADRIAKAYAPVVHTLAALTFFGWTLFFNMDWQQALLTSVAVLIITCPCALGLAVPVVQVVAAGRLLKNGVLLKTGSALERLAKIDLIVFDKTGTLTEGNLELLKQDSWNDKDLAIAAAAAGFSRHPLAKALHKAAGSIVKPVVEDVREETGCGLIWEGEGGTYRLGSRKWLELEEDGNSVGPELWLQYPSGRTACFNFSDQLREDAKEVVGKLKKQGYEIVLLSGDRESNVSLVAQQLGIKDWKASCNPTEKLRFLEEKRAEGLNVAMVGDGLNDAPALTAATVSLSPSTAADISQNAADVVFQGRLLKPVFEALYVSKKSDILVKQNFALALGYNIFTIPLAVMGFVTPLIASVAMSSSSIVVIVNALRLGWTISKGKSET
ncbi:heavy metal translocating P-type ATPase [Curvivirga sp.]|uniref:heavy metal translocating P-type ATPase n=1 Tax=Curvivirga sp. TaxID=2856848 RepID=UPI003B5BBCBB